MDTSTDNYSYDFTTTTDATTSSTSTLSGVSTTTEIVTILLTVFLIVCVWKIFVKAGKAGWASIIPIYNFIVELQIIEKPIWWIILMLIPVVDIVVGIMIAIELAKRFGKSGVWGFFMLGPLAIIGYPILAFGSATYKSGKNSLPKTDLPGSNPEPQQPPSISPTESLVMPDLSNSNNQLAESNESASPINSVTPTASIPEITPISDTTAEPASQPADNTVTIDKPESTTTEDLKIPEFKPEMLGSNLTPATPLDHIPENPKQDSFEQSQLNSTSNTTPDTAPAVEQAAPEALPSITPEQTPVSPVPENLPFGTQQQAQAAPDSAETPADPTAPQA